MANYFNADYYFAAKAKQLSNSSDGKTWTAAEVKAEFTKMGITAEQHYLASGQSEGLQPNAYFNETEYLESKLKALQEGSATKGDWTGKSVADLKAEFTKMGITAAEHYEKAGAFETRADGTLLNPSNAFDANAYFAAKLAQLQEAGFDGADTMTVQDVVNALKAAGASPVSHFLVSGAAEAKADGVPLVQTVPSEQRMPNDPGRTAFGENVPSNYNPPSKAPAAAVAAPVTKPADVGGLSADAPAAPSTPVKVPGDAGYIAPPATLKDLPGTTIILPTASSGTGPNASFIVVDNVSGVGTVIKLDGETQGTIAKVEKDANGNFVQPKPETPITGPNGEETNTEPKNDNGDPVDPPTPVDPPNPEPPVVPAFTATVAAEKLTFTGTYAGDQAVVTVTKTETGPVTAKFAPALNITDKTTFKEIDASGLTAEKGVKVVADTALDSIKGTAKDDIISLDLNTGIKLGAANVVETVVGGGSGSNMLELRLGSGTGSGSADVNYTVASSTMTLSSTLLTGLGAKVTDVTALGLNVTDTAITKISLNAADAGLNNFTTFETNRGGRIYGLEDTETVRISGNTTKVDATENIELELDTASGGAALELLAGSKVLVSGITSASGGSADSGSSLDTLTLTGSGELTLKESVVPTTGLTIDATAMTGGTVTTNFKEHTTGADGNVLNYSGGANVDNIVLVASGAAGTFANMKVTAELGSGDDTVTIGVGTAGFKFATGSTLDGGANSASGGDTIVLTNSDAAALTNNIKADFTSLAITNVEKLDVKGIDSSSTGKLQLDLSSQAAGLMIVGHETKTNNLEITAKEGVIFGVTGGSEADTVAYALGADGKVGINASLGSGADTLTLDLTGQTGGLAFVSGSSFDGGEGLDTLNFKPFTPGAKTFDFTNLELKDVEVIDLKGITTSTDLLTLDLDGNTGLTIKGDTTGSSIPQMLKLEGKDDTTAYTYVTGNAADNVTLGSGSFTYQFTDAAKATTDTIIGFNVGTAAGADVLKVTQMIEATGVILSDIPADSAVAEVADKTIYQGEWATTGLGNKTTAEILAQFFAASGKPFTTTITDDNKAILVIKGQENDKSLVVLVDDSAGTTKGTVEADDLKILGVLDDIDTTDAFVAGNFA